MNFPPRLSLLAGKVVWFVVDMQPKYLSHKSSREFPKLLSSCCKIIKWSGKNNVPLYLIELNFPEQLGNCEATIPELVECIRNSAPRTECIQKKSCSTFAGENNIILEILRMDGIDMFGFCGVSTHVCIERSASDAIKAGFKVMLPNDAHANVSIKGVQQYNNRKALQGITIRGTSYRYADAPEDCLFADFDTATCLGLIDAARAGEGKFEAYKKALMAKHPQSLAVA